MPNLRLRLLCLNSLPIIAMLSPCLMALTICAAPSRAQQAGGVAASAPQVRMVRSVVGAKGEQRGGSFVMTDPRSTFYVPEDHEVIVYFEWEAALGTHHCEGSVRGPGGQFATMSSFNYNATQPRFAGFWKIPLSPSTTAGAWIFESHVDGEPAGEVAFQVIPSAKPANLPAERVLPTTGDIYKMGVSASVSIDALDSTGKIIKHGSGLVFQEGLVATSFRVVEGASALRLHFSDGKESRTDQLFGWNRSQDWAVLPAGSQVPSPAKLAEAKSWNIGDRCLWLDVNPDGSRIIRDGQIVGLESPPVSGDRINLSGPYNRAALGGPLFNEQGQIIGLLGGTLPATLVSDFSAEAANGTPDLSSASLGGIAVPENLLPTAAPGAPKSLPDLLAGGEMMPVVSASKLVLFGLLSDGPEPGTKKYEPADREWKTSFQKSDRTAVAIVAFNNKGNLKTTTLLKLYDMNNHVVAAGKQDKLNISKGQTAERTWELPFANLSAGFYRVDVLVGDNVAWRQYFKLTD